MPAEIVDVLPKRYRVVQQIGAGGMGRVYRVHDTTLGRDVAVKLIEAGPSEQRERFVREARTAARVHHPFIATVHDVDPDAGWLVMELVEGESLRALLGRGPLPPSLVARIAGQVLEALGAAHDAGIVHRDVKPSNIMLGADGNVKLVDFGVARSVDSDVTQTGQVIGTPAYMPPEQLRGLPIDARTDLYALGATLYQLVTGEMPGAFGTPTGAARDKLDAACASQPALAAVIAQCLEAEAGDRYPTARAARAALIAVDTGVVVQAGEPPAPPLEPPDAAAPAPSPAAPPPSSPSPSRRWLAYGAAVVAVIAVGAGLGSYVAARGSSARDPRVEQAFLLAQRGENDKALTLLADYLAQHPHDPDAQTIAFLATWWQGDLINDIKARTTALPLRPAQRAMVEGIDLITQRRDAEAIATLEAAQREMPNAVEIVYTLGEAQWHGQHIEEGAATLERAFQLDPQWEMALHHVIEYRLSRGEQARLLPVADQLRKEDPAGAATLDCGIRVSDRAYDRAIEKARATLKSDANKIPELYLCLAQAQALAGDLDGGMATAKTAFELWPLGDRDRGGLGQYAEFLLYRGKLDEYLELMRGKQTSQRALALLLLRPTAPVDEPQPAWPAKRMAPLGAATWMLQQHVHGVDASAVIATYPEPEVRLWGQALAAEAQGDRPGAIALLRQSLAVPQKGDIHMLVSHRLAKLLHESGDSAGALAACHEVIVPRYYMNYRAIVLPDCLAWSKSASP